MLLRFATMYFFKGDVDHHSNFAISQPPLAGRTTIFIIGDTCRCTLFHPYTLWSAIVPHDCEEIATSVEYLFDRATLARVIYEKWIMYKELGLSGDFQLAEQVLTELGGEIPHDDIPRDTSFFCEAPETNTEAEAKRYKKKRGKEPDAARFRPIKMTGRRSEVAQFFCVRGSLPEAMVKFNMTRSGVLSHLYCIWRDHGVGYSISNNGAELLPPPDVQLFEKDPQEQGDIFV